MKLLSVSVSGFKNVSKTTIELGGITVLASPNNYGSPTYSTLSHSDSSSSMQAADCARR